MASTTHADERVGHPPLVAGLLAGLKRAFSIDLRTIALFRVLIGGLILADLFLRGRDYMAFMTDDGVMPRWSMLRYYGEHSTSLYFFSGGLWFSLSLQAIAAAAAVLLIVGYRSRLMALISWVLLLSLHNRTGLINTGADDLLRLLVFWGMFLPLGACWSFDRALQKNPETVPANPYFGIASVAILMQVLYVYWVGALLKTGDSWQVDYTAVHFALSSDQLTTWLGRWVQENLGFLLPFLTRFVYYIEQYGPLLLVSPVLLLWLRLPILLLLIAMHAGFALLLSVGIFPYVSITSLLLLLPKECWDWLAERTTRPASRGIVVYYDKGCEFCHKTVRLLKTFLLLPELRILPAQDDPKAGPVLAEHDSWVVQKPSGEYLLEWRALSWLVGRSPLFFWLSWPLKLLTALRLGDRLYHWIGDRRQGFGRFTARVLPWRGEAAVSGVRSRVAELLVLVLMFYVFSINIGSFASALIPLPRPVDQTLRNGLGMRQYWNMFAPNAISLARWPVVKGELRDGAPVDAFRDIKGEPVADRPITLHNNHSSYRWRKYFSKIVKNKQRNRRKYYAYFKCRQWNRLMAQSENEQLVKVSIALGRHKTYPDLSSKPLKIQKLGSYDCPRS